MHRITVFVFLPSTNEQASRQFSFSSLSLPKKLGPEYHCAHVQVLTGYISKGRRALNYFSFCGFWGNHCRQVERQNTPRPTTRPERDPGGFSHLAPDSFLPFGIAAEFVFTSNMQQFPEPKPQTRSVSLRALRVRYQGRKMQRPQGP